MDDTAFVVYLFLFTFAAIIVTIYYKRLREVSREFVSAKTVLEDVILGFTRDLQAQQESMQEVADRSEKGWTENALTIEKLGSEVLDMRNEVRDLAGSRQEILKEFELLTKRVDDLFTRRAETLREVGVFESVGKEVGISPVGVAPSIPIRKEQALAPLTETELRILQLLDVDGDMTAPQIRNVIGLTREHTARLMKKLYVGGYMERRTTRIPYVYALKKEMKNLLGSGQEDR